MAHQKPVTIKEIATQAGLTQAAVSLALSGKPGVSAATRDRVREIANALGYQKDPYTSALMAGRKSSRNQGVCASVIAFVTAFPSSDGWLTDKPGIAASFAAASSRALENGYKLEHFWTGANGALAERVSHALFTRNIRAVLIAPLPENIASLSMRWEYFHSISLGLSMAHPAINRISCDHIQSMTMACAQCHVRGYKRMGLVLTEAVQKQTDRRWLAAFILAQKRLFNAGSIPPLLLEDWDDAAFTEWLERENPDVILSHRGSRICEKLIETGRRIPEDIGVVDLALSSHDSHLSGVFEKPQIVGARAIDLLRTGLARQGFSLPSQPATVLIDGLWIPGNTLRHNSGNKKPQTAPPPAVTAPGPRRPSMRDVAARAGVDLATVSRSLRNNPSISESTKTRVRAAAQELGYRNHPYIAEFMRRMRTGAARASQPVLAFLTAFDEVDGWKKSEHIFQEFYQGAQRRAHELGFRLQEVWHPNRHDGKALSESLAEQNVQGLIIAPLPQAGTTIDLQWERFCVMGLGTTLKSPGVHRIISDAYSSMKLAIRKCRELGYRRIGMVASTALDARVHSRWSAAFLLLRREDPDALLPLCLIPDNQWGKAELERWRSEAKPDLILSPNPIESWLNLTSLNQSGDVAYVSLNCQRGGWITGIDQSGELLGSHAADMLVGLIERNEYGLPREPNTILLNGLWNRGSTAGPTVS